MKDRIRDMDKKILAVFIVLFLFNVILWFYLISFNYGMFNFYLGKNNVFNIGTNFYTIISVLIFFTFMTSKLPKLFSLGNNPLYEFGYLLILGFFRSFNGFFLCFGKSKYGFIFICSYGKSFGCNIAGFNCSVSL